MTTHAAALGGDVDLMAEREGRLRRLVAAFRIFARFGLTEGTAGHLTVRDPVHPDTFWAAPFGRHFALVRVSDLVRIDSTGRVHEGTGEAHPAAPVFHGPVFEARPDVMSVGHAHSDYGRAMAALGRRVLPITQDACMFVGDIAYDEAFGGVGLDLREGRRVAAALGSCKAVIMRNHGLMSVGETVDEMVWWFLALEKVCKVQLVAEAAGTPTLIDDDTIRETVAIVGTPRAARLNAAPVFEWIEAVEPDL